jgi:chromosome segregation ATPase
MSDHPEQDITTQILIQIRDEMRSMGSRLQKGLDSLDARMGAIEARMDSLEARMDSLEARMDSLEGRMDSIEARMDSLEGRVDSVEACMHSLEARMDSLESRNAADHQRLFRRFDQIDADLKRFVVIVNDAILHYADETDSVRDRLDILEKEVGIPPRPE